MYKVLKSFVDLQDGNHKYLAGDMFPREGFKPSDKRIKELSGYQNKLHLPLIAEVKEDKPVKVETVKVEPVKEEVKEEKPVEKKPELKTKRNRKKNAE